jgi:hypothetical protein
MAKAAGVLDTPKSTTPNWDPGLSTSTKGGFMYDNVDAFPDEISGVVTGFEQTDGVVQIKSKNEKGILEDDLYIFYGHDDSILHAYKAQDDEIKGRTYLKVSEKDLYTTLGISDGIIKESLRSIGQAAEDHFSTKKVPRGSLNAVSRVVKEHQQGAVGADAIWYLTRAMVRTYSDQRIQWAPSEEFLALHEEMNQKGYIGFDQKNQLITKSDTDKEGKFERYFELIYQSAANGESKDLVIASIQDEANKTSARNPKAAYDIRLMASALIDGSPLPSHVSADVASVSPEAVSEADEGADLDLDTSTAIQVAYDSMTPEKQRMLVAAIEAEAGKKYRATRTKEISGIFEILNKMRSQNPEDRLDVSPVNTKFEGVYITLSNTETVSARIQALYDSATFEEKESFVAVITKNVEHASSEKMRGDMTALLGRVTAEGKADRLDMKPVLGTQLVVEPKASFFDLYTRLDEERGRLSEKRNANDGALSEKDASYSDQLDIVEKIVKKAKLDTKVISSKIGGWITAYDPRLQENVIFDASVLKRKLGFDTFKNFKEKSNTVPLRKAIRKLEYNPMEKLSAADLVGCGFKKEQADEIVKLNSEALREELYTKAIWFGEKLNIPKDIMDEYVEKSPQERAKMGDRFLQTLILRERGAKIKSTKELTTPDVTDVEGRPRIYGGIPRSIAVELMGSYKNGTRMDKGVDLAHFSTVSFLKNIDIQNKGGEEVGIKGRMSYNLHAIIGKEKVFIAPHSKSFIERLASSIQTLRDCDVDGTRTYDATDDEGRPVRKSYTTDVTGAIDFLIKTTEQKLTGSSSNGKKDELNGFLATLMSAKMADRPMEAIKKGIFESSDETINVIVKACNSVNVGKVSAASNHAYIGRQNKTEINDGVKALRQAMGTDSSTGIRYLNINSSKTGDELSKDKKTLTGIQYWMARKLGEAYAAVVHLKDSGLKVATEKNIPLVDNRNNERNTIWYAPEFNEALDTLHVLHNQTAEANEVGNGYNGIRTNQNSPYSEEVKVQRVGYSEKLIAVKDGFKDTMLQNIKLFGENKPGEWLVDILKKGLSENKVPTVNYADSFAAMSRFSAGAQAEGNSTSHTAEVEEIVSENAEAVVMEPIIIADMDDVYDNEPDEPEASFSFDVNNLESFLNGASDIDDIDIELDDEDPFVKLRQ